MMNSNNDNNDKYNNFSNFNNSMEMSLSSLIGRVHHHHARFSSSPAPQESSLTSSLDWPQQRRNRIDSLQDILVQALDVFSETPSHDSSNDLAPPRSQRNNQSRSGNSVQSDPDHSRTIGSQ
jgi:hypothetical protein